MRGHEILDILKRIPMVYEQLQKLCCIDTLPSSVSLRSFIIVNRDKQSEMGSHWFVCVRGIEIEIRNMNPDFATVGM